MGFVGLVLEVVALEFEALDAVEDGEGLKVWQGHGGGDGPGELGMEGLFFLGPVVRGLGVDGGEGADFFFEAVLPRGEV